MTWQVVGSGDSILSMSLLKPSPGGTILAADRWFDVEHGRNAYTAGMTGRASTASIWRLLLSRSQQNGYIVIEDNALGVSDYGWTTLMRRIRTETPPDRWLVGVLCGFRADVNRQASLDIARRMTIMSDEFQKHPRRAFVFLNHYMLDHPAEFPDGQHPNTTAQTWIRGQVYGIVGIA